MLKLNKKKLEEDFTLFSNQYTNTFEYNSFIYDYFEEQVNKYKILSEHWNIVEKFNLGFGEKAFRYLWSLLFSQVPENGKFLEIGVYKGSILSLSQLISEELEINLGTWGLTPLKNLGDKYSIYDNSDFDRDISFLYENLSLNRNKTTIIDGLSTDTDAKNKTKNYGPFDIVYIDGGHDYDVVCNDIEFCTEILKKNGLMVMDDASIFLKIGSKHKGFLGHFDVGNAIRDKIDNNKVYEHLFACGHNRVWRKKL
jgi:hypothetical protein